MVNLAVRNIMHNKKVFILTIIGIGYLLAVVLLNMGMFLGVINSATNLHNHIQVDLWIVERRAGISTVPLVDIQYMHKLSVIFGVESVYPITIHPETILHNGRRLKQLKIDVVGYHPDTGLAAPWEFIEIEDNHKLIKDGIIISEYVAKSNQLKLGDVLTVSFPRDVLLDYKIVGIAANVDSLRFDYAFVSIDDTLDTFHIRGAASFLLVKVKEGFSVKELQREINNMFPEVVALTTEEVNQKNINFWYKVMGNQMLVVSFVLIFVACTIISILIYSLTIQKKREFGILLAIGTKKSFVNCIILIQTFLLGLSSFIIGIIIHFIFFIIFKSSIPKIRLEINFFCFTVALIVTFLICFFSALLPLNRIKKIDPMEVFK